LPRPRIKSDLAGYRAIAGHRGGSPIGRLCNLRRLAVDLARLTAMAENASRRSWAKVATQPDTTAI